MTLVEAGVLRFDAHRRAPGRGAYVCDDTCAALAIKRKAFNRSFRKSERMQLIGLEVS
jgi:predicted RNA-binding protein YlxR (DUF448 family)